MTNTDGETAENMHVNLWMR